MGIILLHGGNLDLSQWAVIFIAWVVIPALIIRSYIRYRDKKRK
jgi:hypothetical protein